MKEEKKESSEDYSTKKAVFFSFAGFTDVSLFQFFTFLIFTFYYAVIGLHIFYITLAFIIWSVWNAFNDPFLGSISDRTTSKWGRRTPWIVIGLLPLLIVNILLWTPPIGADQFTIFIYFLTIIIVWEFFYTMYELNQISLFPEMFRDLDERAKANNILQLFQIIALMVAFILPSLFIPKYDDPQYYREYMQAAIVITVICSITGLIFIKFGIKERIEFSKDPEEAPSFLVSIKYTLGNKAFRHFIIANFAFWFVFAMVPTIVPLYGSMVLGINDSFILSLLLAITFISALIFVSLWKAIVRKFGVKKSFIAGLVTVILTSLPFMFISNQLGGFITFFLFGIGLAGALILRHITIAAIIDDDELRNGVRREGGFYGINGFFTKLTNVAVFICIAIVFYGTEMTVFNPGNISEANILGLRVLMFVFPAIFLSIGIISMINFPITKEKYDELTENTRRLHLEKKKKLKN